MSARPTRSRPQVGNDEPTAAEHHPAATGRTAGWVIVVLGVWMMLAPSMWEYGEAGGVDARYNDVVVGLLVTAIGVARLIRPRQGASLLTMASIGIGLWLVIGPVFLTYGYGEHATRAAVSDILIGMTVAALAVATATTGQDDTR